MELGALLTLLGDQERQYRACLHLTPPENSLSPLARLPFVLDAYSRYFFSGSDNFHGGRPLGTIEQTILLPLLREIAGAAHVNVRPLSGLNCMTAALAGLSRPGETVLTVPLEVGGHMSTSIVATRLGAQVKELPMRSAHEVDLDRLESSLKRSPPELIYIDQSTHLFPIDPRPIRELVDHHAPATVIHYDSSHTNGLIFGTALPNPLRRGAHSFGGSTHKTFPGPHKAFLATNNASIAARWHPYTENLISHHHLASVASLAIALLEWKHCNGARYAQAVIDNAQGFGRALHRRGTPVAEVERGITGCHQVWVPLPSSHDMATWVERLLRCGIIVNSFSNLPGIAGAALRLSLAEFTRYGAEAADVEVLAEVVHDALTPAVPEAAVADRVRGLRQRLDRPRFCFELRDLADLDLDDGIRGLCEGLFALVAARPTSPEV
jgi:glycine/serine hydroxymethyltransferase